MAPVQMGGHRATSHLVPALLPPHMIETSSRLPAMAALFFGLRHAASKPMRNAGCQ